MNSKSADTKRSAEGLSHESIAAVAAFRYEMVRFLNFSKEAAEKIGLTAPQYQAMLFIKGFSAEEKINLGELAEKLFLTHHATVELIDRMQAHGLVERCADETDKRRVLVKLTPEGRKKLIQLVTLHLEELSHSQLAEKLQALSFPSPH